jgi:hypothetical protein
VSVAVLGDWLVVAVSHRAERAVVARRSVNVRLSAVLAAMVDVLEIT